jgi:hypothetical protein
MNSERHKNVMDTLFPNSIRHNMNYPNTYVASNQSLNHHTIMIVGSTYVTNYKINSLLSFPFTSFSFLSYITYKVY